MAEAEIHLPKDDKNDGDSDKGNNRQREPTATHTGRARGCPAAAATTSPSETYEDHASEASTRSSYTSGGHARRFKNALGQENST